MIWLVRIQTGLEVRYMISVVSDTTASLSLEEFRKYDITAVPLYIRQGETAVREVYELSSEEFYRRQRAGERFATSAPDPANFVEAFKPAIEAGGEVVCVTLSGHISGTINSANVAKQILDTDRISIVDSFGSGFGQAAMAIKAREMAIAGATRAEIVAVLEDMRARTRTFFVVESLRYLYEGGRLSGAQALIGSIIQVKPIIWFDAQGQMTALEKIRTLKAAKARALELVKERAERGVERVGLHYGDNLEEAKEYAKEMEAIVGQPVELMKLSGVLGTHTGPDIIGPSIISKE